MSNVCNNYMYTSCRDLNDILYVCLCKLQAHCNDDEKFIAKRVLEYFANFFFVLSTNADNDWCCCDVLYVSFLFVFCCCWWYFNIILL